jgi:hypothetical protein
LELAGLPSQVPSLAAVLAEASATASLLLRGGRRDFVPVEAPSAAAATNGGPPSEPVPAVNGNERLSALLKRQNELANLTAPTINDETEYAQVVTQIAQAQEPTNG